LQTKLDRRRSLKGRQSSRIVLRNKYHDDGTLNRRKAKLVAKDCSQRPGIDCGETFAPVARMSSVRIAAEVAINDVSIYYFLSSWRIRRGDGSSRPYERRIARNNASRTRKKHNSHEMREYDRFTQPRRSKFWFYAKQFMDYVKQEDDGIKS